MLSSRRNRSYLALAALAVAALACGWLHPAHVSAQEDKLAAYQQAQSQYSAQIRAWGYDMVTKDRPFAPSNATTESGGFMNPKAFPTAQYCEHCHQEAYHQWRESLHSNSFREPFYRKNVDILIKEKGIEYSRHCEGCHDPIALFGGALTKNAHVDRAKFDSNGVTCMVCHSIQKLQPEYGLGSYVMGVPAVMVDEKGNPIPGTVPFDEILAHPERHSAAVMKEFYKSPEFCGTCHKANLPRSMTNYKWLRAIGLYDEWQGTSVAKQSPLPFYIKDYRSCQDCHMSREPIKLTDYGAKDGKLYSHRFLGGNTTVPFYYNFSDQLSKTVDFLKNATFSVDIFALRDSSAPAGELIAPIGATSFRLRPTEVVQAWVVIQNKGVAHSLIPEQRDFFESWVEFIAKDDSGREIYHSGFLQPNGVLDPRAHSFTNRLVDTEGKLLARHEIWDRRAVAYDATIQHGRSTLVRYEFRLPKDIAGHVTLVARMNYRHFRQDYMNFVLGDKHPDYPVVEMASRTRVFNIGENQPDPAPANGPDGKPVAGLDNPLWMRWNNFGIALLDQQQYLDSVRAFEKVAALRPDYPDAQINVGVANIAWEKYGDARAALEKALAMLQARPPAQPAGAPPVPTRSRALYYLALVERNQGHLEKAVEDLEQVVAIYPRSRDARRELGFSYRQQNKYQLAREQYEALQQIDPDDLAAHYQLAIIYRRLGEKQKAAEQAAFFADKKDDPLAAVPALDFLRKHPEVSNESVPFHVHSDIAPLDDAKPVLPPAGTQGMN